MIRTPKCLVVEDEFSWICDTLNEFPNLDQPDVFRLILLGNEEAARCAQQNISNFVRVESQQQGQEDLSAYLATTMGPRDLVIMDVLLDKQRKFNGPDVLVQALELLDKRVLDEFRNELRVIFVTRYPAEFTRLFDSVQILIKSLHRPVKVIEKIGDFYLNLRDAIDAWRVGGGLFGNGPGPLLRDYLEGRKEMYLNFQPIVNLRTGHIHSYEVFARDATERGEFPRAAFQDAYGLGQSWPLRIDMLALESFLKWIIKTDEVHRHYNYSLNVCPSTLVSSIFYDRFLDLEVVGDLPIKCANLGFELLEKQIAHFEESNLVRIRSELRRLGYRFEIDDYGMGAASPDRLLRFKPDVVKLDKELVGQFCKHNDPIGTGKSLSTWALNNNVTLIAEGVDSTFGAQDVRRLIDCDFMLAQGFLFGGASSTPTKEILEGGARTIHEANSCGETRPVFVKAMGTRGERT